MKILFICTHNRCRSILSEAITNHLSDGTVTAYSAGSSPSGVVHPLSIKYLIENGYSATGLRSQSLNDFEENLPDFAITVCDNAANEPCPIWFSPVPMIHWGLSDPSKVEGSEEEIAEAFNSTIRIIENRAKALLNLDLNATSKEQLKSALEQIAEIQ